MSGWLTGAGGLLLMMAAVALSVVLDAPSGHAGWRVGGPARRVLVIVTFTLIGVATVATWLRLHP